MLLKNRRNFHSTKKNIHFSFCSILVTIRPKSFYKKSVVLIQQNKYQCDLTKALAPLYRSKKKLEGTIDIYWLYDDGGLTLLLPYILSTRTKYSRNKLRIFFLSNKVEKIQEETRNMAELMAKFRYLKSMSFLKNKSQYSSS